METLKRDLEVIVQKRTLEKGESLKNVLMRLDAFANDKELPERLLHYLQKRSYVKALAWLDNPDLPHVQ